MIKTEGKKPQLPAHSSRSTQRAEHSHPRVPAQLLAATSGAAGSPLTASGEQAEYFFQVNVGYAVGPALPRVEIQHWAGQHFSFQSLQTLLLLHTHRK